MSDFRLGEPEQFPYDGFLSQPCYCGHSRFEHSSAHISAGRCHVCPDRHYFEKPELHERKTREAALRANPSHVHERTHTAYACPGFRPYLVCDDCGQRV